MFRSDISPIDVNCSRSTVRTDYRSFKISKITSPTYYTYYRAGQDANITWINTTYGTINEIYLKEDNPKSMLRVPLATIATNVDASTGYYIWPIPIIFQQQTTTLSSFGVSVEL
ncbi:hypothetical protein BJV82DRAFT_584135 [Fennellomyces sp. T-0311]|nr:hypothetical protein BJV82DRAFT_584135 [Fennellomyces sp. T-0311]